MTSALGYENLKGSLLSKWLASVITFTLTFSPLIACAQATKSTSAAEDATTQPSIEAGKKLYTSFCARCHGINMVNNGTSFDLRTFPKDDRPRFERSITQGYKAMPAWGDKFSAEEIASLWAYVTQRRE